MPIATPHRPEGLADFLEARERLLAIAHHIAAGYADADDIVQEAWLRWQHTDRSVVVNPRAFLSRTTSRLSISAIRTARRRASVSAVTWLDTVPAPDADPARIAEQADDLRSAIRLLTRLLAPREQVAYILREAFGWPYRQIGDALGLNEVHARQLACRARVRLSTGARATAPVAATPAPQPALLGSFLEAVRTGDPAALIALTEQDPTEDDPSDVYFGRAH
ncbi:sigma-70 family RNA polymerase sigma factor [Paractinoplanes hotanensis]|uniref:Sigma-70 family RNA polymerase sigma factor n=1 Tax=Paractinoplanes hotanensis TaxID=2906497 RepID=A0ABT0Y9Z2_9ACTN|nr:sigma-70 family RNA polymerase sigma factor [Actinoplanes hotanensis]MCM4082292.1 sigma-70 family RNA polymerase sigma factor [Actinoplanes hotanensis]